MITGFAVLWMLGACGAVTGTLGAAGSGQVLGIGDAGAHAAVLRYVDASGSGEAELAAVDAAGAVAWSRSVHADANPPDARVDTTASPWLVEVGPAAGRRLAAFDAASGEPAWRWDAPGDPEWTADEEVVVAWTATEVVALDRDDGSVSWRVALPAGAVTRQVHRSEDRTVVADDARLLVVGPTGAVERDVATYPGAQVAGGRAAVWTDPERATWWAAHGEAPTRLELEGRVRPGGGDRDGLLVVPLHLPSGQARLVGVGEGGAVRWTADVGRGSFVALEPGGGWPGRVPFLLEHDDGSRRVLVVDVDSGGVTPGGPILPPAAQSARRARVGDAIFLVDRLEVLDVSADLPTPRTLPGPERERPAGRIAPAGVWSETGGSVVFLPWSRTNAGSIHEISWWGF